MEGPDFRITQQNLSQEGGRLRLRSAAQARMGVSLLSTHMLDMSTSSRRGWRMHPMSIRYCQQQWRWRSTAETFIVAPSTYYLFVLASRTTIIFYVLFFLKQPTAIFSSFFFWSCFLPVQLYFYPNTTYILCTWPSCNYKYYQMVFRFHRIWLESVLLDLRPLKMDKLMGASFSCGGSLTISSSHSHGLACSMHVSKCWCCCSGSVVVLEPKIDDEIRVLERYMLNDINGRIRFMRHCRTAGTDSSSKCIGYITKWVKRTCLKNYTFDIIP